MTSSTTASYIVAALMLVCGISAVAGQATGEIHGDIRNVNGRRIETLGGSLSDPRTKFSLDGLRAGDYQRGHAQIDRQIFGAADGSKGLTGHAGIARDNFGGRANNFGLGLHDPKTSINWDRQIAGPVRTDTFTAQRNFFTSPDGRGKIGGYAEHTRNNFGMRDNQFGVRAGYNF